MIRVIQVIRDDSSDSGRLRGAVFRPAGFTRRVEKEVNSLFGTSAYIMAI